jgi:hypothetical protein
VVLSLPHLAHNKRSLASNLVPLRQLLKAYNDVRTDAEDDEGGAANDAVVAALEKLRELCVEVAAKDAAVNDKNNEEVKRRLKARRSGTGSVQKVRLSRE